MRKIFSILTVVLLTGSVFGQSPEKMSFQAVIRNSSDELVTNTEIGMQISILQDSETGPAVYIETQTPTTNANGLVTIEIGAGTSTDEFSAIDWSAGPYFVKTETDLAGGTDYTITGTSQLLSVPYALHSKTAESIKGGHYIGELYGGGIVFWLTPNGQHGLIASLDDLEGGNLLPWSNVTDSEIGTSAQSMTDGASNTTAIIGQSGHTSSSAQNCKDFTGGGFTDWYLPSNRELYLLVSQDILIDSILDNDGDVVTNGFSQEYISPAYGRYWSSTEGNNTNAWYYSFSFCNANGSAKSSTLKVRAVRAF